MADVQLVHQAPKYVVGLLDHLVLASWWGRPCDGLARKLVSHANIALPRHRDGGGLLLLVQQGADLPDAAFVAELGWALRTRRSYFARYGAALVVEGDERFCSSVGLAVRSILIEAGLRSSLHHNLVDGIGWHRRQMDRSWLDAHLVLSMLREARDRTTHPSGFRAKMGWALDPTGS